MCETRAIRRKQHSVRMKPEEYEKLQSIYILKEPVYDYIIKGWTPVPGEFDLSDVETLICQEHKVYDIVADPYVSYYIPQGNIQTIGITMGYNGKFVKYHHLRLWDTPSNTSVFYIQRERDSSLIAALDLSVLLTFIYNKIEEQIYDLHVTNIENQKLLEYRYSDLSTIQHLITSIDEQAQRGTHDLNVK